MTLRSGPECRERDGRAGIVRALLLLLLLALTSVAGSSRSPVTAQSPALQYELVETWRDRAPSFDIEALDWPAGHEAGGLGIAPDGSRIAVVDRTAAQIRNFDASGRFEAAYGELGGGSGPGQLRDPYDVALLPDGSLAISDQGNDRVQIWGADGVFLREWLVDEPRGITWVDEADSQGIFVVSRSGARNSFIDGYDPSGQRFDRFSTSFESEEDNPRLIRPLISNLDWVKTEQINDGGSLRKVPGFLLAAPQEGLVLMVQGPQVLPQLLLLDRMDPPRLSLPGLRAVATWSDPATGKRHGFAATQGDGAETEAFGIYPLAGVLPQQAGRIPVEGVVDLAVAPGGSLFASTEAGPILVGDVPTLSHQLLGLGRLVGPRRVAAGAELLVGDEWPRVQRWSLSGQPEATLQVALRGGGTVAAEDLAADIGTGRAWALSADAILREVKADGLTGFQQASSRPWESPVALAAGRLALDPTLPLTPANSITRLAMLDLAGQRVRFFDTELLPMGEFDLAETDEPFREWRDIAIAAGMVVAVDGDREALQIYDRAGRHLREILMPLGVDRVTAGPEGSIIVLTPGGWGLAFDALGRALGAWPMNSKGVPRDISVGADERLYAAGPDQAIRVYRRVAVDTPASPPELPKGCALIGDKYAAPDAIPLGATVTVTLQIEGRCRGEERAADVLLLIDTSGSMGEGRKYVVAKNAAIAFVSSLNGVNAGGANDFDNRVAVLGFHSFATVAQALTEDRKAASDAIGELTIGGGTNIVGALHDALAHLRANPADPARGEVGRAIVLLSDGRSAETGLDAVLDEIQIEGIDVYTIGLGEDVDPAMLERIASRPESAYLSPGIDALRKLYDEIGRRILEPALFAQQRLVDRLPANMEYIPGSASPAEPSNIEDAGRTLVWSNAQLPADGWRIHYQVRPSEIGLWPTNVEAHSDFEDGLGENGRYTFPIPSVRVYAPQPKAIYLPLILREACPPKTQPNEIVLLIDASSSMKEAALGGGNKLDAALAAARTFLDRTELGRDRVAVIAFNDRARRVSGLSADRAQLDEAIDEIRSLPGTRLALGIEAADAELAGARHDAGRVIVLLTDGRASDPEPGAAEDRANAAKATGITIFSIGLGADIDIDTLRRIASAPELFYVAPNARDLSAIYASIATTLPCPASQFWGRR